MTVSTHYDQVGLDIAGVAYQHIRDTRQGLRQDVDFGPDAVAREVLRQKPAGIGPVGAMGGRINDHHMYGFGVFQHWHGLMV